MDVNWTVINSTLDVILVLMDFTVLRFFNLPRLELFYDDGDLLVNILLVLML